DPGSPRGAREGGDDEAAKAASARVCVGAGVPVEREGEAEGLQRGGDGAQIEAAGQLGGEPPREAGHPVGARDGDGGGDEVRDGEHDPPGQTSARERLPGEAIADAGLAEDLDVDVGGGLEAGAVEPTTDLAVAATHDEDAR